MDSILTSIKKMLGIEKSYEHFDADIIMHINTVFMSLSQMGVGPKNGFVIRDEVTIWTDYIPKETLETIEAVKTYVYLNVKLLFDPPTSSSHLEAINKQIEMLEWRLYSATNFKETDKQ